MNVDLPYADGTVTATLPPGTRRLSSEPAGTLPPLADLDGAVRHALAAPLGLPRLRDLVKSGARVTIAFDDHTTGSFGPIRPVAIRAVLDELAAAGVARAQVRLVCANALHRMCRPAELARLLDAGARGRVRAAPDVPRRRGPRADRRSRRHRRARLPGGGEPARHRSRPHRLRQHQLHPRLHRRVEVGLRRALDVAVDPGDARSGRHVDVARPQPHARGARRDGPPSRAAARPAHLQDRHAADRSVPRRAGLRGRRRRDAPRRPRGADAAVPAPAGGGARAGRHPRLRRAGLEPLRDLGPGQSDPDAHLDGARLSGRHDRGGGQAGLHRDHGGGGARGVGPRAPPLVPGGVGARAAARRAIRTRSTRASRRSSRGMPNTSTPTGTGSPSTPSTASWPRTRSSASAAWAA